MKIFTLSFILLLAANKGQTGTPRHRGFGPMIEGGFEPIREKPCQIHNGGCPEDRICEIGNNGKVECMCKEGDSKCGGFGPMIEGNRRPPFGGDRGPQIVDRCVNNNGGCPSDQICKMYLNGEVECMCKEGVSKCGGTRPEKEGGPGLEIEGGPRPQIEGQAHLPIGGLLQPPIGGPGKETRGGPGTETGVQILPPVEPGTGIEPPPIGKDKGPCAINNNGCEQVCNVDGRCLCQPGYRVSTINPKKCIEDRCSICEHICIKKYGAFVQCACKNGYLLVDNMRCKEKPQNVDRHPKFRPVVDERPNNVEIVEIGQWRPSRYPVKPLRFRN